ncbi:MAG: hypothetical protein ACQEUZ_06430 [Pseudomonadota bacterium]
MSKAPKFEVSEAARAKWPTLKNSIEEAAFDTTDDLIEADLSPSQAGSVVAHALIRAAWKVAACGRLADGHEPNPDHFREAVETALSSITFMPNEPATRPAADQEERGDG